MFTVEAVNVGVTSTVVPTYASDVTEKVSVPVTSPWSCRPISLKVAIPELSVVAVTKETFEPEEVKMFAVGAESVSTTPEVVKGVVPSAPLS
jgi:hypothetical protein